MPYHKFAEELHLGNLQGFFVEAKNPPLKMVHVVETLSGSQSAQLTGLSVGEQKPATT